MSKPVIGTSAVRCNSCGETYPNWVVHQCATTPDWWSSQQPTPPRATTCTDSGTAQHHIGAHPMDWADLFVPPGLDEGIKLAVTVLLSGGVETFQSCEGTAGHAFTEPTVEFHGSQAEGMRALAWARTYGLEVDELRRVWSMQDGEPVGPHWAMTFRQLPASPLVGEVTP